MKINLKIALFISCILITNGCFVKQITNNSHRDKKIQKILKYRIIYDNKINFNFESRYIIDFRSGFINDSICVNYKFEKSCYIITTDQSIDFALSKTIDYDENRALSITYNNFQPIVLNPKKKYKYIRVWYDIFKKMLFIEFSNREIIYF